MPAQGSSQIVDLEGTIAELAPRVLRYAAARVRDASLAEDVAQESLAALVRRCRNGRPPDCPDAFVFAIARRRSGRAIWRRRFWRPIEDAFGTESPDQTPEAEAIARAEVRRVREALGKLSRRDREAILLVAAGGLSMADTASALGISIPAAKMRVSRARARLATLLEA